MRTKVFSRKNVVSTNHQTIPWWSALWFHLKNLSKTDKILTSGAKTEKKYFRVQPEKESSLLGTLDAG